MTAPKSFNMTGGLRPQRSRFDLSHTNLFDCDMGQLIPVCCEEVVPGDHFKLSNELVVRLQPLVAPTLTDINVTTHYFFVPYRLLHDEFPEFISGGIDGEYDTPLPTLIDLGLTHFPTTKGGILDYLGFPISTPAILLTEHNAPLAFPLQAYNLIYNEYYRDQNFIDPIELNNLEIRYRAWEKDYFTSVLPWTQRGTAPGLPVDTTVEGIFSLSGSAPVSVTSNGAFTTTNGPLLSGSNGVYISSNPSNTTGLYYSSGIAGSVTNFSNVHVNANIEGASTAFNVNDLRLAFQIQKFLERNARGGVRYPEFLQNHFGVSPRDETLQRPQYIGGTKSPIIISEVLQTSSTDDTTPQGNLAGHGIGVSHSKIGQYFAKEYGLIMGIMSITPKPAYFPQGVARSWLRRTKYDFYLPELAHIGEQGVFNAEIFADGTPADGDIFGFQGQYDELSHRRNKIAGNMRDYFDYWHLARKFQNRPVMNESFIECKPDKRIFVVPSEPAFIVHYGNRILATRPMPILAEPGLIDHF